MMWRHVVMVSLSLSLSLIHSSYPQDCPSRQDLMSSLRQAHKLLSAHEASYLQSLRTLRKKLSLLQGAALRLASRSNGTCPTLDTPANGRKLGKAMAVGHEVHFLCEPGFELVGSETRVCQESLSWSGQQPSCTNINECAQTPCLNGGTCVDEVNQYICMCPKGWTGANCQTPSLTYWSVLTNSSSASSRPSRCTQLQGSTHCTCEAGFTLSGRDSSLCTDIDECELFRSGRTGRLCVHACVNTAGSYRCACPAGYALAPDQRRCRDVDECASRQHNCTREDVCVNTYGGFQCVRPECPRPKSNATYVKTSPLRCERSPCPVDQQACAQAPSSVSFHYLPLVSNLSAPRVLFRVSAARVLGDSLRFGLLGGRGRRHFTVQRSDRRTGQLLLVSPVKGPAMLDAEMEMTELERGTVLGRYVTKVTLLVSPYDF
ncbi:fibulin-7 isoform X1 [Lepisosteus oculatus]|uniref:fibulin-7 isoform X1 n=1 Tax=Lepisosteus oculatus TaxID=7918 RepID=UPI0035F514F3